MTAPVIAEFLGHLLRASWQASVLALVVWLVIQALGEHLDARWRCRLWMLVIVRLAWPVSLPSPVSLYNVTGMPPGFEPHPELAGGIANPSITLMRFLETPWVQWTWGVVAGLLLIRTFASWLGSAWIRWRARPLDSWEAWWLLQNCKQASKLATPVSVWESAAVKSPCLLGLIRPRLLLPKGLFGELKLAELRLVFLHELAHLRRRDLAFNWLMAAVELIHWFNPLVWFVTRQLRTDREEDCDALALATEPEARSEYGEVMLKLIERSAVEPQLVASPSAVRILGSGESDLRPLLHRIRAIKRFRPDARTWLVGYCTWLAVALIGFTDAEPAPMVEVVQAAPSFQVQATV